MNENSTAGVKDNHYQRHFNSAERFTREIFIYTRETRAKKKKKKKGANFLLVHNYTIPDWNEGVNETVYAHAI